ncbi:Prenylcysteine lyase-domain-containing protein [Pseudomassariella vexata]|uniref:Prenylcysteine lyase-domain-containing protein n=1 Tax=Pseudomassariella vexata TaxID=1141098 RepID=A0A1Y2E6I4_9PEZI|nr:Prenylcysteine lyase-domain-containing protein [Pseudomassariella vexata]ORY67170.1 Prenylcysteine lyase-domain-containing protein [Pseudomassariella vexata]
MLFPEFFNRLLPTLTVAQWSQGVAGDDEPIENSVKQIAIIGAGAAGSSTAYALHKYAQEEGLTINVTLFEKTDRIGGRTLTVNVYDNPIEPVELGASIFVKVNNILWQATQDFNLSVIEPGTDEAGLLGIWDGDKFVYQQDSESWEWWSLAKLFWQYGTAPYYTNKLVQQTVASFLKLYEAPYFPFRSLTTRVFELGLVKITGVTGLQFLAENKLDGPFAHEIVQTGTRVNYASNLAYIHGMGAMVSMAAEGSMAIAGGNWQIFSNMVKSSNAHVYLKTSVTSIGLKPSKQPNAPKPKYILKTADAGSDPATSEAYPTAFDDVVIATPYQFSNISHGNGVMQRPIDTIPYATLHVTLFASPFRFSTEFFNLKPGSETPTSVLTTLGQGEEPQPGSAGAGKAGFYSATLVKKATNPKTTQTEYIYKIFSPNELTPEFLSSLLGVKVPETFTRSTEAEDEKEYDVVDPISWYYPTVFHPYPQELPRVTFQDPVLGPGLYYTSGIESFISTMETSALMGKNVARLIVDDYLAAKPAEEQPEKAVGEDQEQKAVGEDQVQKAVDEDQVQKAMGEDQVQKAIGTDEL